MKAALQSTKCDLFSLKPSNEYIFCSLSHTYTDIKKNFMRLCWGSDVHVCDSEHLSVYVCVCARARVRAGDGGNHLPHFA